MPRQVVLLALILVFALPSPLFAKAPPQFRFVLEADLELLEQRNHGEFDLQDVMEASIEVAERRLDGMSDLGYEMDYPGANQIVLTLSGANAPQIVRDVFGITGKLDLRLVDLDASPEDVEQGIARPGSDVLPMVAYDQMIAVRNDGGVSGDHLTDAVAGVDPDTDQSVINLSFDAAGAEQFAALTSANVGKPIAIVLDGEVLSAPSIMEPIQSGKVQISGNFTRAEANTLAIRIRSGSLPAPFSIVEEKLFDVTD